MATQTFNPTAGSRLEINPWLIAVSVMLGTFMEVLDTTVVNVSLQHIAGDLSASTDEATWVLTSYLVSNAIVLPLTGWLSNQFGRRNILLMSVGGFTLFSFLCGIAPNLPMLILFRVLQGATGGGLQPLSQAIMMEAFPPEKRGKAMAFWALGIVVAPMIGPVLGGWITDSYSWRWLFYINIPVGAAAVLMALAFIHDPPYIKRGEGGIDYWGIGLAGHRHWLSAGHCWIKARKKTGLVRTSSSGSSYRLRSGTGTFHFPRTDHRPSRGPSQRLQGANVQHRRVSDDRLGFVLYGSTVLLPLWLQTLMGYPALQAGFAMLPRGLGSFLFMPIVGILMGKIEPRKLLGTGLVIAAYSIYALSRLNLNAGYWDIFWPQLLQGASMGLLFVPLTTITNDPIPKEEMGNATSLFNLMRNIGASVGIASVTTLTSRHMQQHLNDLGRNVTQYSQITRDMLQNMMHGFMAQGMDQATAQNRPMPPSTAWCSNRPSMLAYTDVFFILAVMFLACIPLIFLMKKPKKGGGPGMGAH